MTYWGVRPPFRRPVDLFGGRGEAAPLGGGPLTYRGKGGGLEGRAPLPKVTSRH